MKRNKVRTTIVFTDDFATHKAKSTFTCDSMLAREIVNRGVAIYQDAVSEKPAKTVVVETKIVQPKPKKSK